jgi:hypothetical protein
MADHVIRIAVVVGVGAASAGLLGVFLELFRKVQIRFGVGANEEKPKATTTAVSAR